MIQVDDRAGSAQLAPILRSMGMDVSLCRLEFGDVSFTTISGEEASSIGIEVKSVTDVIQCVMSGRFAGHQLPGLLQSYDYCWLLIQGQWRPRYRDGALEYLRQTDRGQYWTEPIGTRRQWMWRDLESWLLTMTMKAGIRIHRVPTWEEGCLWVKNLWNWHSRDDHKSHKVLFSGKKLYPDKALLTKPSLARRVAAELPNIGTEKSVEVAARFHTISQMVEATEAEWRSIPGIGKGIAAKVYRAIHQNGNGGH